MQAVEPKKGAPAAGAVREYDVVIVGAGFSGVYQLHHLRKLGFSVRVLEAGSDLGGIWHWNCYPGARVDTHIPLYEFSAEELWRDWTWTERFPGWDELRKYFNYVDSKWDLRKDVDFNTRVKALTFDQKATKWTVTATNGTVVKGRFVVLCTGFAAKAFIPKFEGLDTFAGPHPHTAHWPQEGLDMRGKRVGVVGTGASSIQTIQEASKVASEVVVFQRTPCLPLPMQQRKLTPEDQNAIKDSYPERYALRAKTFGGFDFDFYPKSALEVSPDERRAIYQDLWDKGGFYYWLGTFNDVFFDQKASDTSYEFWRSKTLPRLKNPKHAEILAPAKAPYPYGTKRPSLENGYFEVFNQDNVTLVDLNANPIQKITPTSVVTKDREFPLDILVLGTGFDAVSGGILAIDITGVDGIKIQQRWSDGIKANLGLTSAGFPNLLFVYGPHSPSGFLNGPSAAEYQGDVIIELLKYLREKGYTRFESKAEADEEWSQHISDLIGMTLFPLANSWYMGANIPGKKRESLNYPGGLPLYLEKCKASAEKGYEGFVLGR
ncbi:MAG: flavin-containing monooxygenase [Panacagrimonas sp.]